MVTPSDSGSAVYYTGPDTDYIGLSGVLLDVAFDLATVDFGMPGKDRVRVFPASLTRI